MRKKTELNHSHKKRKDSLETQAELAVLRSYVENQAILPSLGSIYLLVVCGPRSPSNKKNTIGHANISATSNRSQSLTCPKTWGKGNKRK